MQRVCGVYKVTNTYNNKVYIGSSVSCYDRWKQHRYALINNIHVNTYLQNSWNKYGESAFKFEILEECDKQNLKNRECFWIEYYGGIESELNYNLMDARRNTPNEDTKRKISESRKGMKLSDATKHKISDYNKKHPNPNFTNRERTDEERKKISNSLKGNIPWNKGLTKDDARVAKNIEKLILIGSNPSNETKEKISKTLKELHEQGMYNYSEATKKRTETFRKHKEQGIVRKPRKDKGIKKDPEVGKRISEAKRKSNERKRELGLPLRNTKEGNKCSQ